MSVLDAARIQSGMSLSLQLGETDLVTVTCALVKEHQLLAPDHRIEARFATESVVGTRDTKHMARVVDNLLSNAINYSPGGGRVQVEPSTVREESTIRALLRITDEGIGIPVEDLARIFQWYSRGKNALQTTIEGAGIGLAGARDIVVPHAGSISVSSKEGQGSSFMVKLPLT